MKKEEKWLIDLGARLRAERERRVLSRAELAKLANTDQGYLVQIESAMKCPSLRLLRNLLTELEVSADYIIFGSTEEKGEQTENALQKFMRFLEKKNEQEILSLYKIIRAISQYKDME